MAERERDHSIPLCGPCMFRPVCHDNASQRAEGELRITARRLSSGAVAAVIYSVEDPRDSVAHRIANQDASDLTAAIRVAQSCSPIIEGLAAGLGDIDGRIATEQRDQSAHCHVGAVLNTDPSLPAGIELLLQAQES